MGLGLREDSREGAPVCRWLLDDLVIDIMPTRGDILGFSCRWYQLAFDTARQFLLPDGTMIRLVTPACFSCSSESRHWPAWLKPPQEALDPGWKTGHVRFDLLHQTERAGFFLGCFRRSRIFCDF